MIRAEAGAYLDSAAEQYVAAYLKKINYKGEAATSEVLVTMLKTAYVDGFSFGHDIATGAIKL